MLPPRLHGVDDLPFFEISPLTWSSDPKAEGEEWLGPALLPKGHPLQMDNVMKSDKVPKIPWGKLKLAMKNDVTRGPVQGLIEGERPFTVEITPFGIQIPDLVPGWGIMPTFVADGNQHFHDMKLFYWNIRKNVRERLQAWQDQQ